MSLGHIISLLLRLSKFIMFPSPSGGTARGERRARRCHEREERRGRDERKKGKGRKLNQSSIFVKFSLFSLSFSYVDNRQNNGPLLNGRQPEDNGPRNHAPGKPKASHPGTDHQPASQPASTKSAKSTHQPSNHKSTNHPCSHQRARDYQIQSATPSIN